MGLNFEKLKLFLAWWVVIAFIALLIGCLSFSYGASSDMAGSIIFGIFIAYPIIMMICWSLATLLKAQTKRH